MKKRIKLLLLTTTCFISALAQMEDAEEWLLKGDSLYDCGKLEQAVSMYRKAAEKGLDEAQFKLGYALYAGEGAERNITTAVEWFKRAARQNYPPAEYNLAFCYMNARGVPRNYERAIELLTTSAQGGYEQAMITLAECYEKGILVEQDSAESNIWRMLAQSASDDPTTQGISLAEQGPVSANTISTKEKASENIRETIGQENISLTEKAGPAITENTVIPEKPKINTGKHPRRVKMPDGSSVVIPPGGEYPEGYIEKNDTQVLPGKKDELASVAHNENKKPEPKKEAADMFSYAETPAQSPKVSIIYPTDGTTFHSRTIEVKYQLKAYGLEKETEMVVMVNGERQPETRAVRATEKVTVSLPEKDCVVSIQAKNAAGESNVAKITLIRENTQREQPRLFALSIGVGTYHKNDENLEDLRYTIKDAYDFRDVVEKLKGHPYSEVNVKLLADSMATRSEMHEAMEWLKENVTPDDYCFIFFAGHGMVNEEKLFFFVPYGGNSEKPEITCFTSDEFIRRLNSIEGKKLVFTDACYSGAIAQNDLSSGALSSHIGGAKGSVIFFDSSSEGKPSMESESIGNGLFTSVLLNALKGAAREPFEKDLDTAALHHFLNREMKHKTDGYQIPIMRNPNGSEPISIMTYE